MHGLDGDLRRDQLGRRHDVGEPADRLAPVAAGEQLALALAIGIAEGDAHQEAVELRLGQGIGAELVGRVLGRDDEERRRAGRASRLRR
jgi:hypothetical protein